MRLRISQRDELQPPSSSAKGCWRAPIISEEAKSLTANERVALIHVKIERARKHISDLKSAVKSFFDSQPYKVETRHDSETRRLIYYVASVEPVPAYITCISGDAIHNLRSVCDHIAQQLFLLGPNRPSGPAKQDYFPIGNNALAFETT